MRSYHVLGLWAVAILLSSCAVVETPRIALEGKPKHVQAFEGTWIGSFESGQSGRAGSIEFILSADVDSAFGDVLMYTEDRNTPLWHRGDAAAPGFVSTPQWLDVRFVRLERGYMSGEMEPFFDTNCNCMVVTRFLGRKEGEQIEGGYTVRGRGTDFESTGTWGIRRVSSP